MRISLLDLDSVPLHQTSQKTQEFKKDSKASDPLKRLIVVSDFGLFG